MRLQGACSREIRCVSPRLSWSAGQLCRRSDAAPVASSQHHDQAPSYYRLKVGDLEVTALYDGYRRIRSALAERTEGKDERCCRGTCWILLTLAS